MSGTLLHTRAIVLHTSGWIKGHMQPANRLLRCYPEYNLHPPVDFHSLLAYLKCGKAQTLLSMSVQYRRNSSKRLGVQQGGGAAHLA